MFHVFASEIALSGWNQSCGCYSSLLNKSNLIIEKLCTRLKHDKCYLANRLPNCKIIWSDLLPRNWIGVVTCAPSSENRRELTGLVQWAIASVNGKAANHPNIEFLEDCLFRVDRVHISDVGNAIITIITN